MEVGAEGIVGVELLIDQSAKVVQFGDRGGTQGLAIGCGHGLERGFLAQDGTGIPAARGVLTIIGNTLDDTGRNPRIGLPARTTYWVESYI